MLLAGCYERFLFGYRLAPGDEVRGKLGRASASGQAADASMHCSAATPPPPAAACRLCSLHSRPTPFNPTHPAAPQDQQLERAFTHAAHKGVVKCAAAAGPYAATGGADDLIHLYDLKVRTAWHTVRLNPLVISLRAGA